ncbi:hypothetical protein CPB85DRAFT_850462 [Mucidula mucida]|nr:hypothetical protein CPB85DRAFT_850462 [Mucidula mucida]
MGVVDCRRRADGGIPAHPPRAQYPLLRDLTIRGKLFPVSNHTLRMFDSAPSLRCLVLQPVASNIPFDHLWPRLTEFEGRFDDTRDSEALVQILRKTPALQWLSVTSNAHTAHITHSANDPVILPHVEVFRARNFFLLHLLVTPVLKHLTVTIPKEDKTSFFRRIMLFLRQSRCVLSTLEISQWNCKRPCMFTPENQNHVDS